MCPPLLEAAVAEDALPMRHRLAAAFAEAALRNEWAPERDKAGVAEHALAMRDWLAAALAAA
jgi:hypothetical protein